VVIKLGVVAFGQTVSGPVTVSVGNVSIKLPAPSGYINAWEKYPNLRASFETNETANNQMLAIFAPTDSIPALDRGRYLGFRRYTKVSVSKSLATLDVSESEFSQFVDLFEKKLKEAYKLDAPDTRKMTEEINRDLKKYFGTDGSFQLKESVYLGPIRQTKNSFISASMMAAEALGKNIPVYNITALVLVRRRVVFVNFYANIEPVDDLATLNAETQKTVDAILAANSAK
jgi:hypothetical protein